MKDTSLHASCFVSMKYSSMDRIIYFFFFMHVNLMQKKASPPAKCIVAIKRSPLARLFTCPVTGIYSVYTVYKRTVPQPNIENKFQ